MANDIEELYLNGTRYGFNDERLANKANIDGAYESMTVGNAEQLISSVRVTDKTPYLFRTAGGNLDIGDRKYTTLVGADVAVNQPVENGDFSSVSTWVGATYTVSGNVATFSLPQYGFFKQTIPVISGHKYLMCGWVKTTTARDSLWLNLILSGTNNPVGTIATTNWQYLTKIYSCPASGNATFGIEDVSSLNETIQAKYLMLIDLTSYFGSSTIADTAYTKEQATAGSGIAWLKANGFDFSKYRAYNAGSLESVNPSAIVTRGFNQWDEEWENGFYRRSNGAKAGNSDTSYFRSKNYIPCLPNTAYYFKNPTVHASNTTYSAVLFYDANKNYIDANMTSAYPSFTTPSNAYYMTFYVEVGTSGATYQNDICINLHWDGSRDGEYEQYSEHEYALGNVPLHGVFKEENGNIVAYGDTRTSDGTKTNNFGQVDLGTLNWTKTQGASSSVIAFNTLDLQSVIKKPASASVMANIICSKYPATTGNEGYTGQVVGAVSVSSDGYLYVWDNNSAYTTAAAFKTAMSGVMLTYELATPTTDTTDSFTNPQVVDNWGTEEFTTENDVPVGNETEYPQNLRDKLESIPNPPNGDGDYIVRQTGGTGEYRAVSDNAIIQSILAKLPTAPSEDGTYKLTCTVTNGTAVYSWEA